MKVTRSFIVIALFAALMLVSACACLLYTSDAADE